MVQIDIRYEGQLSCRAHHGPSGTEVVTDAPVDNHGRGLSFSPTDLLATATGACMATIMGIRADELGIDLSGLRMTVVKEMIAEPVRRVGRLRVIVHCPAEPDEAQREVLEQAAHGCPVKVSLHESVDVPVLFRWGKA